MKQSNLYEFLDNLEEAIRQEAHKQTGSEDTTETQCDFTEPKAEHTPIERVITTFLNQCEARHRVPTLEEAQSIFILDTINAKYRNL